MHAACERFGVEVCLSQEDLSKAPCCPHGPMLLFERFFKDGRPSRKFFACSACRDRKDCAFFQWEDEKISEVRQEAHKEIIAASGPSFTHQEHSKRLNKILSLQQLKGLFCHSCNQLMLPDEELQHKDHDAVSISTDEMLKPSYIFKPLENQKFHAQYLFSTKATEFLINQLKKLKFNRVLCIGTPRLHEAIQSERNMQTKDKSKWLDSLLLDLDHRYAQFFKPSKFCWYNVFNHHFFGSEHSERRLKKFLHADNEERVALVMDPPFGGLVDVLGTTVKKIWDVWREGQHGSEANELPTLWIFPYFLETHISASLPSLIMLDYKVDYDNHPHFTSKGKKGGKRGSPVRIFTNISAAKFVLPKHEGYRFCDVCQRYVSSENVHCLKCSSCTSKDGRTYVHCDTCQKCVKPGRSHCATCGTCEPPEHDCSRVRSQGCHICGALDHKRRHCPSWENNQTDIGKAHSKRRVGSNNAKLKAKKGKDATRKANKRKKFNETRTARKRLKKD